MDPCWEMRTPALAVSRAERPVRTAFKGVFGFIHQAMQIVSVPFVP